MDINSKLILFALSLFLLAIGSGHSSAQQYLLRDDFNQTHRWWWYRNDGPVTPPQVKNGYISANLANPIISEYCNVELMNYQNIFQIGDNPLWMRMRVRGTTGKKPGSWGWGLWYTENPEPGKFYDMAWFMEQLDSQSGSLNTWWRAISGQKANTLVTWQDLPNINNMEWHLYTIYLSRDSIRMWVDDSLVFYTSTVIPQLPMAVHFWVDNHVRDYYGNKYRQSWEGENEFVMDFVEIREGEVPVLTMQPEGIVKIYKFYNEIGYFPQPTKWKEESIPVDSSRLFIIASARVEHYPAYSTDDALWLAFSNGTDTVAQLPFDANRGANMPQTVFTEVELPAGDYKLSIYGNVTPTLYGIAVVGGARASLLVADTTIETAAGGDSVVWKTYDFTTTGGQVAFYISGSADEDPQSNDYGIFDENNDDDLYIRLNNEVLNSSDEYFLDGNKLLGEGKTIFFTRDLEAGSHSLTLISNNTPTKNAVIIIGEGDGTPVSLGHRMDNVPSKFGFALFPNPFNQEVNLRFTGLVKSNPLYINIFNLTGQLVRSFALHPDENTVNIYWNGRDEQGNVVSSGIYFVTASQGPHRDIQKLILIR